MELVKKIRDYEHINKSGVNNDEEGQKSEERLEIDRIRSKL